MPEPITLPPSTLHLGQQVKVRWIDGKTTTGILAGVDADAMHVVDGVADIRIPYSLIDVAVRVDQPTPAGDPADRYAGLITGAMDEIEGIGEHPTVAEDYWDHPSRRETKRLIDLGSPGAILDELQSACTEWDDAREALAHLVDAPRAELVAERERNTRIVLAKQTAERAVAQMADRIQALRADLELQVKRPRRFELAWRSARRGRARVRAFYRHEINISEDLEERLREAQAERDRAFTVAAAAEKTLGEQIDRAIEAEEERDEARAEADRLRAELADAPAAIEEAHAALDRIGRELAEAAVRSQRSAETMADAGVEITNLMAQRDRLTDPKAMADAIVAHLHPPHEWPDGPPGEGEWERAVEEAQAIIAALTKAAE